MISYPEALKTVLQHSLEMGSEKLVLSQALNRILATDVISKWDHPFFDHSAVDGFVFRVEDIGLATLKLSGLKVIGEIPAGISPPPLSEPGTAYRIFTGAAVPDGADTIVMQEFTTISDGKLFINDERIKIGGNIRKKGEQVKAGSIALSKGSKLNPALCGYLASIGVENVVVSIKPRICILVTGNEFIEADEIPGTGKIFESNGITLISWLETLGYNCRYFHCKDDLEGMKKLIDELATQHDILLITGGASVGDYDFTKPALEGCGFRTIFHKVNQRPGKPLLFSASGIDKVAFGLPGNPRSVIMCFLAYVVPFIHACEGSTKPGLPKSIFPLAKRFTKNDDKTHFNTVALENSGIVVTSGQASHMLRSFEGAAGVGIFPEEKNEFEIGDTIEILFTNLS